MAEDVAETTESLPKVAGLVGLDRPLDQLDLTKMLAESFEPEEQEVSEETSPSGDAVEEAEPVEESPEEAGDTEHVLSQEEIGNGIRCLTVGQAGNCPPKIRLRPLRFVACRS